MIDKTNTLMLKLLADVLHDRIPDRIPAGEWLDLLKELHVQMVYALPGEYITSLGLSENDTSAYMGAVIRNRQIFHKLMREQKRILSLLEEKNIPVVVLKGAAAAINYNHPENRCMGDIDLLVLPQDFDKAYNLLIDLGYMTHSNADYKRHIGLFIDSGIEIELHRFFSSSDNKEQNILLDEILFQAIPKRVSYKCCGYPISILPPLENGLVLLGHINQHLSAGLGLRQIIDWMVYVEKYLDDEMWNNGFSQAAEKIGMKRLAIIVTAMCQKYLGFNKNVHWCKYEPVCDELMEYILSNGNFGRKNSFTKHRTVSVLKYFNNPFYGFAKAQHNGLINWKATKTHPILRPFAWCYQFGRWIKKGLIGGITPNKLMDAKASAKKEAELLKKLGVTRL